MRHLSLSLSLSVFSHSFCLHFLFFSSFPSLSLLLCVLCFLSFLFARTASGHQPDGHPRPYKEADVLSQHHEVFECSTVRPHGLHAKRDLDVHP